MITKKTSTKKSKTSAATIKNIKKAMANPSPGALRIPKNF